MWYTIFDIFKVPLGCLKDSALLMYSPYKFADSKKAIHKDKPIEGLNDSIKFLFANIGFGYLLFSSILYYNKQDMNVISESQYVFFHMLIFIWYCSPFIVGGHFLKVGESFYERTTATLYAIGFGFPVIAMIDAYYALNSDGSESGALYLIAAPLLIIRQLFMQRYVNAGFWKISHADFRGQLYVFMLIPLAWILVGFGATLLR